MRSLSGVCSGAVMTWCIFHAGKYLKKHKWLLIKPKGTCIYCTFCMRTKPNVQSGSSVFISKQYTLNGQTSLSSTSAHRHMSRVLSCTESLIRDVTKTLEDKMMKDSTMITADSEACCDTLFCVYFSRHLPSLISFAM